VIVAPSVAVVPVTLVTVDDVTAGGEVVVKSTSATPYIELPALL
jgi:hypothetical protein